MHRDLVVAGTMGELALHMCGRWESPLLFNVVQMVMGGADASYQGKLEPGRWGGD